MFIYNYKSIITLLFVSFFINVAFSQEQGSRGFSNQRAEEDYRTLKDSTSLKWLDKIKYISINKERSNYVSLGGSFRPRYQNITNQFWVPSNNENYYSQRAAFHADIHLGKHFRLFSEIQSGYVTQGDTFLETDDIDFHQVFVEYKISDSNQFIFRFGRQEMKLGAGRLVDYGLGPNIRRSFDMGKITYTNNIINIHGFYGKAVEFGFRAFDNRFNFFEEDADNQKLWGLYSQFSLSPVKTSDAKTELYYLGFQSDQSGFNDVLGKEVRHSIGTRFFGKLGKKLSYNTEIIYQFGKVDNSTISAFNFETDWDYLLISSKWRPTVSLKLDWSTGDKNTGDGKINSFNPMFVNPALYSLAVVNTPVNLTSIHPSFTIFPSTKLMINAEFAMFYRSSENDGLYAPPNRQIRMANESTEKHIGNTVGLFVVYNFNRSVNFNLRTSYFITGDYIEKSGSSANLFQLAPTLTYTF